MNNLADWVSGIGSLLAVAVAIWFSTSDRLDRRAERLAAITIWAEKQPFEGSDWILIAANDTSQPIINWACRIQYRHEDKIHIEQVESDTDGILPPGRSQFPWHPGVTPDAESQVSTTIRFRDATGAIWERRLSGKLRRLPRSTPSATWSDSYPEQI